MGVLLGLSLVVGGLMWVVWLFWFVLGLGFCLHGCCLCVSSSVVACFGCCWFAFDGACGLQ